MNPTEKRLSELVLAVHRRNGGEMEELDLDSALMAPELGIDSMDLAEIMVAVEREFGVDPFGTGNPPGTWREVLGKAEKMQC